MSVGLVVGAMLALVGATTVYLGLRNARLSSGPVAYLQQLGSTKGGHEEDRAIGELKKLGYTGGS